MIGVLTDHAAYRAAIAELPTRTRPTADAHGAVVVIDGEAPRWPGVAVEALRAGAAALVVREPRNVDGDDLDHLERVAGPRPVVMSRAALRADVVTDVRALGGPPPAAGVAEVVGPASAVPRLVRDGVGWLRALGGGPVEFVAAFGDAESVIAGLRAPGGVRHSLVGAVGETVVPRLRVAGLGDRRVEVVVDEAARTTRLTSTDDTGDHASPRRLEALERVALRRALEALAADVRLDDLAEWRADDALAMQILGSRPA